MLTPSGLTLAGYQDPIQIHEGKNSQVFRMQRVADRKSVILKILNADYPTSEQLRRYRQEYHLAHQLQLPGVIAAYALETYQRTLAIVFEDFQAISLKQWLAQGFIQQHPQEQAQQQPPGSLALTKFLPIAIRITEGLSHIHGAQVIHKDINPTNIVLNPTTGRLKLIDLGISTQLSRENPTLKPPTALEGTLAYISPEQTGRMNRPLDYRTDFYSLGVTFYELLSGQLPFATEDVLELVHCHLAKTAVPLHDRSPDIPLVLSELVAKLMAKNPEDRYQSALGIKADLVQCLKRLRVMGQVTSFGLGEDDIPDRLQIPQKLYGRDQEVQALLGAFERMTMPAAPETAGNSQLILVTGYAGIGKSSLVQELYKPITAQRGYFTSGKFDQFQRNIPYSALGEALARLVRQWLGEPETQLQQWREKLQGAVGNNGRAIVDMIPDVELILGVQPAIPALGPMEAQNRFNRVFQSFLRALCSQERPLVIFLDDLQWADAATLKLMERIVADPQIRYLLLLGAYRDHEVGSGHPLAIALAQWRQAGVSMTQITLPPLQEEQVSQLLGEALRCPPETVADLAALVMRKTRGNPFFIGEFLKALYREQLLVFVQTSRRWQWELERIEAKGFTDNVVDLILEKVQKLPGSAQGVLSLAACLGTEFSLESVRLAELPDQARTQPRSAAQIFADLTLAIDEELLLPRSALDENLQIQEYQFVHDRIQQAAYALIPENQRPAKHLHIGRTLLHQISGIEVEDVTVHSPEGEEPAGVARNPLYRGECERLLEDRLFEIIDHLNRGLALVTEKAEQEELARLNLKAGQKALAASAYKAAMTYLSQGMALLGEHSWKHRYELSLTLHDEAVKAAFLNSDFESMERLATTVLTQAKTVLDQVKVTAIRIEAYGIQGRLLEAIDTGLELLAHLGTEFPPVPDQADFIQALVAFEHLMAGRDPADLISLPKMVEPQILAALHLLVKLTPVTFISSRSLNSFISIKAVELCLRHGNTALSAVAYACLGVVLCGAVGDLDQGYAFGQLALALASQPDHQEFEAIVLMIVYAFISHWKTHLRQALAGLQRAHSLGMERGEFAYAGYAAFDYCVYTYLLGTALPEVHQTMQHYSNALKQIGQKPALSYLQIYHQGVCNLMGASDRPYELVGEIMNEPEAILEFQRQQNQAGLWHLYTAKLPLCYLFEEFALGREVSDRALQCINSGLGGLAMPLLYFYDSLCRLALCLEQPGDPLESQAGEMERIQANQQKLERWGQAAPMNYLHKFYLVKAEYHRIAGQRLEAMDGYDRAITTAKAHHYLQEEALANELAAKFYGAWGKETIARAYMLEARYGYLRWGAKAKVQHLETHYPHLCQSPSVTSGTTMGQKSTEEDSAALDLAAVIRSSQAIFNEIVLENLLETLMKLLLESAGAQIGYLLLHNPTPTATPTNDLGTLSLEAQGHVDTDTVTIGPSQPLTASLPESILYYVARSKESLVLDHAAEAGAFIQDPYIQAHQPQSILCYPLLNRARLVGIVYLENNLTPAAFTPNRIELLQLLSVQAAISIENAKLYANLEQKVAERTAELAQANEELQRLSNLDGLTKVANRRRFDEYMAQEWQRHLREQRVLALILVDIDYFKPYNDHYGHQGGDDCLGQVAQAMARTLKRPTDLVARYGGEEFTIILPGTDGEGALVIAEAIRKAVEELAIPHAASEVQPYVTLSLGVASIIPTIDRTPSDLIAAADAALYQAKRGGRDRVVAAPTSW